MRGTITRIFTQKKYGFIKGEDNTFRFFHASYLPDGMFESMREGLQVDFDSVTHPKGARATNIHLVRKGNHK